MRIFVAMLFAALFSSPCSSADISNKELIVACSGKTIVYGREKGGMVRAGEKLNGFCSGYLQATVNAFENSNRCSVPDSDPGFILSIYTQYMKDRKVPEGDSASRTITGALRRVAECK